MKFRLGAMSVGDILDRSLKLLFSRLGTFYAIGLIIQLPLVIIQIVAANATAVDMQLMIVLGLVILFLTLILNFVAMAAQLKVIEQEFIDNKIGVGGAIGFAFTRFVPLILVSITLGLVVFVGMLLCIVPGIIFFCLYAFSAQAVVLEGYGPFKGMDRSAKLAKGFKGRIFGILCLTTLLNLGLSFGLGLALNALFPTGEAVLDANKIQDFKQNTTNHTIQVVINSLVQIVITTYTTICLTLTYFDLRTRKEGFDLELAARGLPQEDRPRRARADRDDDEFDDEADDRPRRSRRDDDDDDLDERRPRRRD